MYRKIIKHGVAFLVVGHLVCGQVQAQMSGTATINSGGTTVRFETTTGVLSLQTNGHEFASAQFNEAGHATCVIENLDGSTPFGPGTLMKIGPGENRVLLREGSPFVLIRRDARATKVSNPGNRCVALQVTLDLGMDPAKVKGLGPAGLFDPAKNPGQHVVSALANPATGAGVVAGFARIDAVSGVLLTAVENGRVRLTLRDDYGSAIPPQLAPEGGDWWAVGAFADARDGLEAYASEFARLQGLKLKPLPVGYMSWYSEKYGGALNETVIIELSRYLAATFKEYGYGFVQIDDLWQNGQKRNGPAKDFTKVSPTGPYPNGMKPVAKQIRALGFTPGLWLLPFAIDHQDPILANRVPLIARKTNGAPYEANWSGTALDLTKPEARDYVRGFIRQAVSDWGYTYLKLDGLHIGLASPQTYPNRHYVEDHYGDAVFADKTMSNMQAARAGLKAVRDGAGAQTFILGCCVPQNERSLGMTMGLVDAMRVGPDSGVAWDGVIEGVRCSASLYFLNGRVWWNDPDSIYARAAIPLNEVQCFAGWVTLAGMLNNQTDWAPNYPPERVELLRRTMPAHQLISVRPVDLFENDPARIWVLTYAISGQKHTVVGLFNWTGKEIDLGGSAEQLGLSPTATHAGFEFWTKTRVASFRGELRQRVPARTGRIIAVRELSDHPVLLSTSRHVSQGAVDMAEEKWDPDRQTFSGASRVVGGDPYEIRLLASGVQGQTDRWKATVVKLSEADRATGVTASLEQESGLTRITIRSPASRAVQWSVSFAPEARLSTKPESLPLWAGEAPVGDGTFETNRAVITVYHPPKSNGASVVICPGGGYGGLVTGAEGHGIAQWLNQHGITGIVLEYRLPRGKSFVPLLDAQRAIRTVRSKAGEWQLDPQRIGIMGFSAGGHLASTAGTHFDGGNSQAADLVARVSSRPDFMILIYPVITMSQNPERGSRRNLLGSQPEPGLVALFSNEKQVTRQTPPAFLAHALDDKIVLPADSRMFYEALQANQVAARFLELPSGGHGLNGYQGPMWTAWQTESLAWLAAQKFIPGN